MFSTFGGSGGIHLDQTIMSRRSTRRRAQERDMEELRNSILVDPAQSTPVQNAQRQNEQIQGTGQNVNVLELIQALQATQLQSRSTVKVPNYDGESDIDLYLMQFNDVCEANHWTEKESLLHLRLALSGKALECGRGESLADILDSLKARFGISTKKARDRLKYMRKTPHESVQELGMEISKLINLAYPKLDHIDRNEMAIEVFSKAMDNRALQRHLLARPPMDIPEAVNFTEEFLQVGGEAKPTRVATISDEDSDETVNVTQSIMQTLKCMQETLCQQAEIIKQLHNKPAIAAQNPVVERRPVTCYECGGPHLRRNCPGLKGQYQRKTKPSGNAYGPTQSQTQLGRDLKQ